MRLFDFIFNKSVKEVDLNKISYLPGQKEPEEYISYIAEVLKFYNEAQPFSYPIIVVGFEYESVVEKIINGTCKIKLKGKIKEKKIFMKRNPVIRIEYPSVFISPKNELDIIEDAKALKKNGASDISGIISTNVAEKIVSMFGKNCCPVISVYS